MILSLLASTILLRADVDFERRFETYDACFLIREIGTGNETIYNPRRVAQPLSPCSTFKIPNALIGLDSGVVTGKDTLFRWDGKPKGRKAWEKDHTLESAFKASTVWYFQRLAREIGVRRMRNQVDRLGYGNRDISGGIDKFWLMSSLKITARQQVDFLQRLYLNKLPLTARAVKTVKGMMVIEAKPGRYVFSGKTGSGSSKTGADLGWFVGSIETGGKRYVFAANILGKTASGLVARDIVKTLLRDMRLMRG